MTTTTRFLLLVTLMAVAAGCKSSPLVAPVASTISVFASSAKVDLGGTVQVVAEVIEEAGTPVHDGTLVRFTATLGSVEPFEAETRKGIASATFTAGSAAGVARVTATSGAASGGEAGTNAVEIVVGEPAVTPQ